MSPSASALARRLVRGRAQAQMVSTVTILRGALGVLDPATGQVGGVRSASTVYVGMARIRSVEPQGVVAVGGGEVDVRRTVVSIPIGSPVPRRDDLVRVDTDSDVDLATRFLRVTDVDGGGLFGDARRLYCTGWHESRSWGQQ